MAFKTDLLLAIAVLSNCLLLSAIEIGSKPTCFVSEGCLDLTNFTPTTTTRQEFWNGCGDCDYQLEEFNEQVCYTPEVAQFCNNTDVLGIYVYPSYYSSINYDLRNPNANGQVSDTYYWLSLGIAAGITALKDTGGQYTKLTWRSESGSAYEYVDGKIALNRQWMSTSYSREFAYQWGEDFTQWVFLVLVNSKGRDINYLISYPDEYEVLISPGIEFQVMYTRNVSSFYNPYFQVFAYEIDAITANYTKQEQQALLNYMIKMDAQNSLAAEHVPQSLLRRNLRNLALDEGLEMANGKPPAGWACDRKWYNSSDGCDCMCGVWDPDCDRNNTQSKTTLNCFGGASPACVYPGKCTYGQVPSTWVCDNSHYNSKDGCDVGCGAFDPDCYGVFADTPILTRCTEGRAIGFNIDGDCIYAEPVPSGWTCNPEYYDALDGCDINCGVPDPDCTNPQSPNIVMTGSNSYQIPRSDN